MSTYGEACEFIGNRLMSLAETSSLTRNNVIAMLGLIKYMRDKYLSPDKFISSIKKGNWMRTSRGVRSPVGSILNGESWKVASEVSDIPFIDQEYYGDCLVKYKTELGLLEVVAVFNNNYEIVKDYLKSSNRLNYLTSDALILLLKCIRFCTASDQVVAALIATKCIKTTNGFRYPSQCFIRDPLWGCLLQVFDEFPSIDVDYYGADIRFYNTELRRIGVVVDLEVAAPAFLKVLKEKMSRSSVTKEHVFSLLSCIREIKRSRVFGFPDNYWNSIAGEKWLRTRLAAYNSPKDCILFGPEWEPISKITTLPFIDDSDKYYGKKIHEYRDELVSMGVLIDIKKSARFVLSHIYFPCNMNEVPPSSIISLLDIIRFNKLAANELLKSFLSKVSGRAWLKTTAFGYKPPAECLLFGSKWGAFLTIHDGPFIDEEHYGPSIASYEKELQALGVTTDIASGSSLLAKHLCDLSDFDSIKRVYTYLEQYNWELKGEDSAMIWIPNGVVGSDGAWASPADCILHNKDNLFGSRFIVLDKYYESKLLSFFVRAFEVRSRPSMEDYCQLWKDWESSGNIPSHTDCCSFWSHVVKNWTAKAGKILSEVLSRVPASSASGAIQLIDKRDVFIPDDLLLKELFSSSFELPLFVWTPRTNHLNIPHSKLIESYKSIGVRTISSCVVKAEYLPLVASLCIQETSLKTMFIKKGLVMLILGFLCDPKLDMNPKSRHETVQHLLNIAVLGTTEPITMRFNLTLSSGESLSVDASRMIHWDLSENKLYVQKPGKWKGQKNVVEFTTNFAQVLSEGLLWEKTDHISRLSELIKFGFLMEFDVDAVMYYMKSNNLEMFLEDEDFLSSVYPSE